MMNKYTGLMHSDDRYFDLMGLQSPNTRQTLVWIILAWPCFCGHTTTTLLRLRLIDRLATYGVTRQLLHCRLAGISRSPIAFNLSLLCPYVCSDIFHVIDFTRANLHWSWPRLMMTALHASAVVDETLTFTFISVAQFHRINPL